MMRNAVVIAATFLTGGSVRIPEALVGMVMVREPIVKYSPGMATFFEENPRMAKAIADPAKRFR